MKFLKSKSEDSFNVGEQDNPPLPNVLKRIRKCSLFLCRELDETYYRFLGNSFDGNLQKIPQLSPLKRDGIIAGSVWNDYVDTHFNSAEEAKQGKHHVKDNISTADAIRSLNAYYAKGLDK